LADQHVEFEEKPGADSSGSERVSMWLAAIAAASKEEKEWREEADTVIAIYRADDDQAKNTHFNILHSNVETILPAIYNSTPTPDIRRRFNDPGEASKQVADTLERALSYAVDSYDFDGMMRATLWDSSVPGRGVARVRYVPYMTPGSPDPSMAEEGEAPEQPADETAEHSQMMEPAEPTETVAYEEVSCEYVPHRHFRRGPGFTWDDTPWIAFEHFLTRAQLRGLAEDKADAISLDCSVSTDGKDDADLPKSEIMGRARVWEIWDKDTRSVIFVAPSYPNDILREEPDPLELTGFWPVPRPIVPLLTPGNQVPMCPYRAYKSLAEELNEVTARITKLTRQLRVRGVYASSAQDIEAILNADDGELVPAQGLEQFIDGGIDKAISWWPVEPAVKALSQLYEQRERVKQTIYEVTGLSDIVRGATKSGETATAQQIKSQWGSLRIQRLQAEVARFARDLFRMKAEIIATKFSPQTLAMMTGVQLSPEAEKLMRSDLLRSYKIDIETDSTIRADLSRNQENMTNFVMGTANYVQAIAPAIQGGILPPQLAIEIYTAFARNFKLGKQVEDALDRAGENAREAERQPKQEQPDPEMQKAQAEMQMKSQAQQAEMQMAGERVKQDGSIEMQRMQMEFALKREQMAAEMALKREEMTANLDLRAREIELNAFRAPKEMI